MIVTICKYYHESHATFEHKLCVRTETNNLVYQANKSSELYVMLSALNIDLSTASKISTKTHRNYFGNVVCLQTIYFIPKE